MGQIHGEMFTSLYETVEDFENGWKRSVFYVEKDYMSEYRKHMAAMSHVAQFAKVFILKNWESVKDWSDLDIKIVGGARGRDAEPIHYYKYVERPKRENKFSKLASPPKEDSAWSRITRRLDEERKAGENPVVSVSDVVLDPTDGDFSITINGTEYWWLLDEEVIVLADYVEKQLNKQQEQNELPG